MYLRYNAGRAQHAARLSKSLLRSDSRHVFPRGSQAVAFISTNLHSTSPVYTEPRESLEIGRHSYETTQSGKSRPVAAQFAGIIGLLLCTGLRPFDTLIRSV